ncbi:MAG TPA: hydantoinase/carbamoylase family amidase [Bosea sp. (in: a-proteobacteria)]|uniref:hydantoinase/carbamoylase family amidase n=1 Tax=Bosea sp. (in: a-proteobacteria) TaxID=1871050 RepID=UPI002E10891E|nr:hydantoinase/carbamoylase family amidase [Bosea sp. (in: a-proteobacteria)]
MPDLAFRPSPALDAAVIAREAFVASVFEALRAESADGPGVTRTSYMAGEQRAHDRIAELARGLGLAVSVDAAGNLAARFSGRRRDLPAWITGSHLDSVHIGGNFDGAAGVIAGLTAIAAMIDAGLQPERDIVLMAFRAEESSSWFVGRHGGHLGSRAALGLLWEGELDSAIHVATGRSLRAMMTEAGFDPARIEAGPPILRPVDYAGYVELHIEQGPILENRDVPVGIVTGIRGAYRVRNGRVRGAYSHSGAVPHEYRQDAVFAMSDLVMALDGEWARRRAAGEDLVVTVGRFATEADRAALTKVPGQVDFTIDIRSQSRDTLDGMEAFLRGQAARIEAERGVAFTLEPFDRSSPSPMAPALVAALEAGADGLGIARLTMASGGGHDAQDFADAGIPAAMIFVRNDKGSHNPDEAMEIADFMQATRVLANVLWAQAGKA